MIETLYIETSKRRETYQNLSTTKSLSDLKKLDIKESDTKNNNYVGRHIQLKVRITERRIL